MKISDVKKWLNEADNSKAKLAYLMGYQSTDTISKWLQKGVIPHREIPRLVDILKGRKS